MMTQIVARKQYQTSGTDYETCLQIPSQQREREGNDRSRVPREQKGNYNTPSLTANIYSSEFPWEPCMLAEKPAELRRSLRTKQKQSPQ